MLLYKKLIFPILSKFDPEDIHNFTFSFLKVFFKLPFSSSIKHLFEINDPRLNREVSGLKFKNPVGLAAGFDKNAFLFEELGNFGFGFIEIGTVTPKPQSGNDRPRLFRLKEDRALINRMGFNGLGVKTVVKRLKNRHRTDLVIGGNIGKNKITPNENAVDDYVICFEELFPFVDYFVVNVSSPNTPGLRSLQDKEPLTNLLNKLQELNLAKIKSKPILLKIAPDLTNEQLDEIVEIVLITKIAGVIATNTTIAREPLLTPADKVEKIGAGGLSGAPLFERSTEVVRYLAQKSGGKFPIVASGGITSTEEALQKIKAGASLVQIYTGFIYNGPSFIKEINKAILTGTDQA